MKCLPCHFVSQRMSVAFSLHAKPLQIDHNPTGFKMCHSRAVIDSVIVSEQQQRVDVTSPAWCFYEVALLSSPLLAIGMCSELCVRVNNRFHF